MEKTQSAGGIVLNARGEIALVRHGHTDFWGFPKGHVDKGETLTQAARREIAEESGIRELELLDDLGSYERFKGAPGDYDESELKEIHLFLFRTTQEKLAPSDPENPEARWVPIGEVEKVLTHPKDREFFRGIVAQLPAGDAERG